MPSRRTRMISAMSVAAATSAIGLMGGGVAAQAATAAPSEVGLYIWTSYGSMSSCIDAGQDACFGKQDGSAEGLIDLGLLLDETGQTLGTGYSDNSTVPGVTASDEVVQVYDGTPLPLFVGPGTNLGADEQAGTAKYVATGTSPSGAPLDVSWGYDAYSGPDEPNSQVAYQHRYNDSYY